MVEENESFLAVVPFWAVWPFETMVVPRRHVTAIDALTGAERDAPGGHSEARHRALRPPVRSLVPLRWASTSGPPTARRTTEWHLHAHFYPPLLRSATVRKFMVGYEMLAMPQRDITAETAAERLRGVLREELSLDILRYFHEYGIIECGEERWRRK